MTLCTIIYNATTGDDTTGGTNAPTTPLDATSEGETASTTASSATITFSASIDLTGVNDDGSDVIWVGTPSGDRHLFRITSFTGGVATCTAVVCAETAVATGSALDWGIGGKRQGLQNDTSNVDVADMGSGWRFELEGSGATYPITVTNTFPNAGDLTDGPMEIVAASGAVFPEITWSASISAFTTSLSSRFVFDGIYFNSSSTWGGARAVAASTFRDGSLQIRNCKHLSGGSLVYANHGGRHLIVNCDVEATNAAGLDYNNGRFGATFINVTMHGCGASGVWVRSNTGLESVTMIGCLYRDNTGEGFSFRTSAANIYNYTLLNCIAENNTVNGFLLYSSLNVLNGPITIANCLATNNTGMGIALDGSVGDPSMIVFQDYNAFYNNTGGEVDTAAGLIKGANSVTLTADPYVSRGTPDFDYTLNSTAGGGAACKDVGLGYNG